MKDDVGQLVAPLLHAGLEIGPPEERRVLEAGSQHPLVSLEDPAVRVAVGVDHGQEVGPELPFRVDYREVFLVVTHDRHQHLPGDIQKALVEASAQDGGILVELDDRFQKGLVFHGSQSVGNLPEQLPGDLAAPLVRTDQDIVPAHPISVFLRVGQPDLVLPQEPVATRDPSRVDSFESKGDDLGIPQRDAPAKGPDKTKPALPPVHAARPGEAGHQPGHLFLEYFREGPARNPLAVSQVFALRSLDPLQQFHIQPLAASESHSSPSLAPRRVPRQRGPGGPGQAASLPGWRPGSPSASRANLLGVP